MRHGELKRPLLYVDSNSCQEMVNMIAVMSVLTCLHTLHVNSMALDYAEIVSRPVLLFTSC